MKIKSLLFLLVATLFSLSSNAQWGFSYSPDVPTPTPLPATDVTEYGFQANWETLTGIEGYTVWTYLTRRATEDGQKIYLFHSNFDYIESDGTIDNPDDNGTSTNTFVVENFNNINRYGWQIGMPIYANGVIGFNNCLYGEAGGLCGQIMSPAGDLSIGDGKVYVELTVCGGDGAKSIAVSLKDGSTFPNTLIERQEIEVTPEWKTYTLAFEGGREECYIYIEGLEKGDGVNPLYYFIDELGIYQNLYKGEEVRIPYHFDHATNASISSTYVETDADEDGVYAYAVSAYSEGWESFESDLIYTREVPDGITSQKSNNVAIDMQGGMLNVSNLQGEKVSVYNAAGQMIYQSAKSRSDIHTPLSSEGLYIVRVGSQSYKIMNK